MFDEPTAGMSVDEVPVVLDLIAWLKEHGDKLPEADKQAVESALAELKTALEGTDTSLVKERTEVLTQASYKLAEYMYKDAGGDAQAAGAGGAQGADDSNVVDAEFTEVSDNDNK